MDGTTETAVITGVGVLAYGLIRESVAAVIKNRTNKHEQQIEKNRETREEFTILFDRLSKEIDDLRRRNNIAEDEHRDCVKKHERAVERISWLEDALRSHNIPFFRPSEMGVEDEQ